MRATLDELIERIIAFGKRYPPSASRSPGASLAKTWNDASLSRNFNQKRPQLPLQPDTGPGISGTEY